MNFTYKLKTILYFYRSSFLAGGCIIYKIAPLLAHRDESTHPEAPVTLEIQIAQCAHRRFRDSPFHKLLQRRISVAHSVPPPARPSHTMNHRRSGEATAAPTAPTDAQSSFFSTTGSEGEGGEGGAVPG